MKKDNFTITLDKLNAIIPIFASEFCDMLAEDWLFAE